MMDTAVLKTLWKTISGNKLYNYNDFQSLIPAIELLFANAHNTFLKKDLKEVDCSKSKAMLSKIQSKYGFEFEASFYENDTAKKMGLTDDVIHVLLAHKFTNVPSYIETVSYLIDQQLEYSRKFSEQYADPANINKLLVALVANEFGSSLLDLTAGAGGIVQQANDSFSFGSIYANELDANIAYLGELKFVFNDQVVYHQSNALNLNLNEKVDAVAMVPPFGHRVNRTDLNSGCLLYTSPSPRDA